MEDVHEANAQFVDLLVKSGWNQARAARELGVTTASVSRYVSGKMVPSLPVLRLFADRLQMPLTIYGGPLEPHRANDGPRWLTEWEEEVLATFRKIPSDARPLAVKALKELTDAFAQIPPRAARKSATGGSESPVNLSERIAEETAAALSAKPISLDPSAPPLSSMPSPSVSRAPSAHDRKGARPNPRSSVGT